MVNIDKSEYISFRQNLDYIIEDATTISNKKQLSFLMAQRGFRKNRFGTRYHPSQKQLDIAWDYVGSLGKWKEVKETKYIKVNSYSYIRNGKKVNVKEYYRYYRYRR